MGTQTYLTYIVNKRPHGDINIDNLHSKQEALWGHKHI